MAPQRDVSKSQGNRFGALIFLLIVAAALFLLFAIPVLVHKIRSSSQCGEGGLLVGSSRDGWHCVFVSECVGCVDVASCPVCADLCASKNLSMRQGSCGPEKIDVTDAFKRDENGSVRLEPLPVMCSCCCDRIEV